jgi:hypothetical protein
MYQRMRFEGDHARMGRELFTATPISMTSGTDQVEDLSQARGDSLSCLLASSGISLKVAISSSDWAWNRNIASGSSALNSALPRKFYAKYAMCGSKKGRSRSFSDVSTTCAGTLQSIASLGSSKRIPASCSGE